MPELPEVETIRTQLHKALIGQTVTNISVLFGKRLQPPNLVQSLLGRTIVSVQRRAKLLIFALDNDDALLAHLKMTGRFIVSANQSTPKKHDHVIFTLTAPTGIQTFLTWADTRKFGYLRYANSEELHTIQSSYGPEPLDFSADTLAEHLKKVALHRSLKAALLDQTVIAGIGNIYADESCFRAGLLPQRSMKSIPSLLPLITHVQNILRESIAQQGTSAHDYVDAHGRRGSFVNFLNVYGRTGQPCVQCQQPIQKITFAGRGTHFCITCQT